MGFFAKKFDRKKIDLKIPNDMSNSAPRRRPNLHFLRTGPKAIPKSRAGPNEYSLHTL